MVVEITRYQPVLDVAIPVAEELVREGRAKVVTSAHPDAVGLVIDLQHLLHTFYRYFDTNVTIKINGIKDSFAFAQYKSEGIEHKLLEIEFNNGLDFNPAKRGDFHPNTVLEASGVVNFPNKIGVGSTNNKRIRRSPFGEKLSRYTTRPKQVEKIKLDFGYMSLSDFSVSTFHQDFSSL